MTPEEINKKISNLWGIDWIYDKSPMEYYNWYKENKDKEIEPIEKIRAILITKQIDNLLSLE